MTEIAEQMLVTGVDVLFGGGEDEFLPISENGCLPEVGERSDGRNLIDEAISMTSKAIQILSKNSDGFFPMVEGG
jgi:alkaline phosphatase